MAPTNTSKLNSPNVNQQLGADNVRNIKNEKSHCCWILSSTELSNTLYQKAASGIPALRGLPWQCSVCILVDCLL